jgi:hypothetical protein
MSNPFQNRTLSLSGPARDIVPVTPADGIELPDVAVALYVETGGVLVVKTVADTLRTVTVGDKSILPVGVKEVHATGTTATGIHGYVV